LVGRTARKMRVLVSFGREYRVYMQAIASAIRGAHSDVQVGVTDAAELEAEVERFDLALVIASLPVAANLVDQHLGVIELSADTAQPSRFRVGERSWESINPTLGEILLVIDEIKSLRRQNQE
jgi:hypothetical protein